MAEDDEAPLDDEQLGKLVEHLQAEAEASQAGTLESVESLRVWLTSHPALRQMAIVESITQIGPAILHFLRAMLGFDKGGPDAPEARAANEGD